MNRNTLLGVVGTATLVLTTALAPLDASAQPVHESAAGSAYTMTNATTGNEVLIFDRDAKGVLTLTGAVATGGTGVGGGLDPLASQNSVKLTDDGRWLLAVNAGSNDISIFRVEHDGLELVDSVASGGVFPTSLAVFQDLVYVLNAGGTPNIQGFSLSRKGHLTPIPASTRALPGLLHSQIGFDPRGNSLVVTDRTNDNLLVYPISEDGTPSAAPVVSPSHGAGPFAFAFSDAGTLLVAEVGSNAVSSYALKDDATLDLITGSVPNGQAATCWIVVANAGRVFTANPGANSVSSYREAPGSGALALVAGAAGTASTPIDMALTRDGRFLYALDPSSGGIVAFQIAPDGTLIDRGSAYAGLPLFAQGLAAR